MLENWLALEPLLIERIKSVVDVGVRVAGVQDIAEVNEETLGDQAVLVVYDGDHPGGSAGAGDASIDFQRWLVVITVRHAAQGDGGAGKRSRAGKLISKVKRALSGWDPSADFGELTKIPAPRPGYSAAFGYFPLAYETYLIDGE